MSTRKYGADHVSADRHLRHHGSAQALHPRRRAASWACRYQDVDAVAKAMSLWSSKMTLETSAGGLAAS